MDIETLIKESHDIAVEKGWWETERPFLECLMLIVSEVSEACEEYRVHGLKPEAFIYNDVANLQLDPCLTDLGYKAEGIAVELADVLIRIADICGKHDIPLEEALRIKLAYNKTRPHRHGGKLA